MRIATTTITTTILYVVFKYMRRIRPVTDWIREPSWPPKALLSVLNSRAIEMELEGKA